MDVGALCPGGGDGEARLWVKEDMELFLQYDANQRIFLFHLNIYFMFL